MGTFEESEGVVRYIEGNVFVEMERLGDHVLMATGGQLWIPFADIPEYLSKVAKLAGVPTIDDVLGELELEATEKYDVGWNAALKAVRVELRRDRIQ